jgi:hypothetical protein
LLFAQAIPPLAAPFAGVIADRFSPGRLLAVGWLTQAVWPDRGAAAPPLALLVVVFHSPCRYAAVRGGRPVSRLWWPTTISSRQRPASGVGTGTVLGPPLAGLLFAVPVPGSCSAWMP